MLRKTFTLSVFLLITILVLSCVPDQPLEPNHAPVAAQKPSLTPTHHPVDTVAPTSLPTATPTQLPTNTPTRLPRIEPTATETPRKMPDSGDQFVEICSRSVSGIVDLTEGQWSYPGQSDETDEGKSEELFDPNSYLGVLDHLALEPGYELDFVYFEDFLGGKPLVYARQSEEAPFGDYSELIQSLGTPSYRETSYGYLEHAHDYMTLIKTDDTAEGYLQLMILALLADQFYLSWHALYNDYMFMCESSDLDRVMAEIEGFDVEISKEVIEEAKSLDLAPSVLLEEDSATVTYVLFTKWGGFIREWYMVSREYPHEIIDGGYEVLIEYDCGIMF